MNRKFKKIFLNWKVFLFIIFFIGLIGFFYIRGFIFGIDIFGGVVFIVQMEEFVDLKIMEFVVDFFQKRFNIFGLRDILVEGQGNSIVVVKVVNVSLIEEVNQFKQVIESQGVFFMEFNGVVFGIGKDIIYVGFYEIKFDNSWVVLFRILKSVVEKFVELVKGKVGWLVDMFFDLLINFFFVVFQDVFMIMNGMVFNVGVFDVLLLVVRIEKVFNIMIIMYINQSVIEFKEMVNGRVIVFVGVFREFYDGLKDMNVSVKYILSELSVDIIFFVKEIFGFYGLYLFGEGFVNGVFQIDVQIIGCVFNRVEVEREVKIVYIVFKSGFFLVKFKVISMEFIFLKFGQDFKKQVFYVGFVVLVVVFFIVYFYYRNWKIVIFVVSISFFEV